MSVSREYAESMAADAAAWWLGISGEGKLKMTGAATVEEADRRFNLISISDRWDLRHGTIKTVANFKW